MNAKPASISENLIEFRDVAYHINDIPARMIVSEISLRIPPGETLVLLGRSGSGKTTLLKLINGMLLPPKGVVLVQNCPTTEWDPIRLRRGIGYVIQEAGLFPHFTVAENVALVPTLENWDAPRTAARVQEMLHLVGLDPRDFAHRLPRELSGGQRQRVGVARALARRLDKTIVFVTHDLREALLLASRIVLLQAGRIVASATPQEFLRLDHAEVRAFTSSLSVSPGALA